MDASSCHMTTYKCSLAQTSPSTNHYIYSSGCSPLHYTLLLGAVGYVVPISYGGSSEVHCTTPQS